MTSLSKIIMAAAATALGFAGTALAQQKEVMIGAQCDHTGPTQIVGVVICPAQQDYISLVNSNGGVVGRSNWSWISMCGSTPRQWQIVAMKSTWQIVASLSVPAVCYFGILAFGLFARRPLVTRVDA